MLSTIRRSCLVVSISFFAFERERLVERGSIDLRDDQERVDWEQACRNLVSLIATTATLTASKQKK